MPARERPLSSGAPALKPRNDPPQKDRDPDYGRNYDCLKDPHEAVLENHTRNCKREDDKQ
jgi:hypothetical protein